MIDLQTVVNSIVLVAALVAGLFAVGAVLLFIINLFNPFGSGH